MNWKNIAKNFCTFSIITRITEFKGFIVSFKSQEQLWFIESLYILHSMDLPVSKGFTKLCTCIISSFEHTVMSYTWIKTNRRDFLSPEENQRIVQFFFFCYEIAFKKENFEKMSIKIFPHYIFFIVILKKFFKIRFKEFFWHVNLARWFSSGDTLNFDWSKIKRSLTTSRKLDCLDSDV